MPGIRIAAFARTALLLAPALACTACLATQRAPAAPTPDHSRKEVHMHDATTPAPSTAIAAQTMAKRWLAFADQARASRDFERARFWKAMELPPQQLSDSQYFEEEPGYQAFTQEFAGGKWAGIASFGDGDGQPGARFARLAFEHPDDRLDNAALDLAPVCGLDLDGFRKALLDAGYLEGPTAPSDAGYASKGTATVVFSRGPLQVSLVTQREAAQPQARRERACVVSAEARDFSESPSDAGSR